ncbi:hypothetical protein EPA93_39970 [Ktedonosporobacter rubrisoli]|uniref:Uncharacterized protein n=1 Tax=Ktedonosporobacter rubrisoli TaxID=2509675 RepID=A0A4P6K176_KTERU|nr:hypothetical protein [Ktedonosporobacter rubrisoli]QBD81824.1 hypothetical protein EPA93_39970 [Ktedonosporobacter rubrisoli]
MPHSNGRPRSDLTIRQLALTGFVLTLALVSALLLLPATASAQALKNTAGGPAFRINAGFDSRYRDGNWVPIQVTLHNDGPDFNGKVSINVPAPFSGAGNAATISKYQEAISLPTGAQKEVTLYVPFYFGTQGITQNITVDLLNTNGAKVSSQVSSLRSLGVNDIFIGILSDQTAGFGPLNALATSLPSQASSIITEPLNAATMPSIAAALKNFDLIVIDNFTTSSLNKEQLTALQNWVNQGGSLIVVGGPEWRNTLSPLPPSLLPVSITGTDTIPAGASLLPVGGPGKSGPQQSNVSDKAPSPVAVSVASPVAGSSVVHSSGSIPLLAQRQQGQGIICYLAFDPTLEPVTSWQGATTLWKGLLLRTLGDQLVATNLNTTTPKFSLYNNGNMDALLHTLFPSAFPATWLILVLLLGYVFVLGPARMLIIRWLKKRDWSWRIVLATILVFSLLCYGLALQEKGTSIISSSISVVQLDRPATNATAAHVTTYIGVFVPSQGDFQVHIPGNGLVQPSTNPNGFYTDRPRQQPTTILSSPNGTDADLQGVDIWTIRTLISQHDSQFKGGIIPHLTLQNNTLTGTVTNTLPYALSDAYVLMGSHYMALGNLAALQTKQVSISMLDNGSGQEMSLADQIASNNKVQPQYGPYNPYSGSSQTQTIQQRHMALLATLSGENAYYDCGTSPCRVAVKTITSNGVVVTTSNGVYSGGSPYQINGRDPLLLPGSSATLIGWADNLSAAAGNITINGNSAAREQEVVVQAPLDINYAGNINVPTDLVSSQLVDMQGDSNNLQTQFPGIYTMTTGSMTFEFTLPNIPNLHVTGLTISEPSNLAQVVTAMGQGSGPPIDANHLHVYLYNWQTRNWDSFTLANFSFSTNNTQPYIGPGGHVLAQFANQDSSLGTMVFSKPSLQLQGTISS